MAGCRHTGQEVLLNMAARSDECVSLLAMLIKHNATTVIVVRWSECNIVTSFPLLHTNELINAHWPLVYEVLVIYGTVNAQFTPLIFNAS